MLSWAHIGLAGYFGALLVGGLGVVARDVSRKTPIYFTIVIIRLERPYPEINECPSQPFGHLD